MATKDEDYRILRLRNEASLCIDDLVAEVVNSTLAMELRLISAGVMEQTPGFTFNLKKAEMLKDLSSRTLRQYRAHTIGDVELMHFCSEAQQILKGDSLMSGGKQMGLFDRLVHGKEIKKKESLDALERTYQDVSDKILACEQEMNRCVTASRGCAPDSGVYRNNERAYNNAANHLKLLKKQQDQIGKALDEAGRIELIKQFNRQQAEIARATGIVLGDGIGNDRILAEAELNSGKIDAALDKTEAFGESLFSAAEAEAPRKDSAFGAAVAAQERRDAQQELAGIRAEETAPAGETPVSDFAARVGQDPTKE